MPRSKRTIFPTQEAPKVDFRIRILEALKTRPDLVNRPNDILEAALEDAVQAGEKEMATLEKISSKSSNEPAPSAPLPSAG